MLSLRFKDVHAVKVINGGAVGLQYRPGDFPKQWRGVNSKRELEVSFAFPDNWSSGDALVLEGVQLVRGPLGARPSSRPVPIRPAALDWGLRRRLGCQVVCLPG